MQSWQQIEINNQILSRIKYHLLKSKDVTMGNSLAGMRLQGTTVVVFITLDWIFVWINTATMIHVSREMALHINRNSTKIAYR